MNANFSRATTLAVSALLAVVTSRSTLGARAPADPDRLFVIERSLNANVVVYDAVRGKDGRLDAAKPVAAYWLMNAEHGQREPLNAIERMEAYGFKVESASGGVEVKVAALASRPIRVRVAGRRVEAIAEIAGAPAVLRRVYVRTDPGNPLKVVSVELFGERPRTRAPVRETLKPT